MSDETSVPENGAHKAESLPQPLFTGQLYDRLKFTAQILLPGLATLYFTVAQIWGLPKAEELVGTIVAVDAFLGLLLGLSSSRYDAVVAATPPDGFLTVTGVDPNTGHPDLQLTLTKLPAEIVSKDVAEFKIGPPA